MRPVNLLPAKYRPRTAGSDSRTAYFTLGALGLVVLAVFGYVMASNSVSSRNSEIAEARQRIAAAQAQSVTLQEFGDFAGIKEARLSAVKSLATARVDWERLFRELAHVLPQQVWLTGFRSQVSQEDGGAEVGPTMSLEGCAEDHKRIADAMVRLRELHVAEEVELTQSVAGEKEKPTGFGAPAGAAASEEGGCGEFYSFTVEVTMSLPSGISAAETTGTVPARLGGGG